MNKFWRINISEFIKNHSDIAWYPSAGVDFRDILELRRLTQNEIIKDEFPKLFIHTDKDLDGIKLKRGEVFKDLNTVVICNEIIKVELIENIIPDELEINGYQHISSSIYYMNLEISSNTLGIFHTNLLYILYDNILFLNDIILNHNIEIKYLVKVCDGYCYGGNYTSMSLIYYYLSAMKTQFLIADNLNPVNYENIEVINNNHPFKSFYNYQLECIEKMDSWSALPVKVYSTYFEQDFLTEENFKNILNTISEKPSDID